MQSWSILNLIVCVSHFISIYFFLGAVTFNTDNFLDLMKWGIWLGLSVYCVLSRALFHVIPPMREGR